MTKSNPPNKKNGLGDVEAPSKAGLNRGIQVYQAQAGVSTQKNALGAPWLLFTETTPLRANEGRTLRIRHDPTLSDHAARRRCAMRINLPISTPLRVFSRSRSTTAPRDGRGRVMKINADAAKIKAHAEYLVTNHEWLSRNELYRRYGEVVVWFQMYFYRQTGYLYRFAEIPTGPLYYQGCEIADQMNRMLIRLYDLERGGGNG